MNTNTSKKFVMGFVLYFQLKITLEYYVCLNIPYSFSIQNKHNIIDYYIQLRIVSNHINTS